MPSVRREEAGSCTCPSPRISALSARADQHPPPAARPRTPGLQTGLAQATSRFHLCQHRAIPCQDRCEEGEQRGRDQELPAPAWAGPHTGGMFLPLPRPPSACHPAHPVMAGCKAWGAVGGALSKGCRRCPASTPPRPRFPSVHTWVVERIWYVHTLEPGDPSGAPTLTWAAPHSLPKPDHQPEHTLGCGHRLRITGLELRGRQVTSAPFPHMHPSFQSPADTPRQPTRTDSHPAPHPLPSISAQECRGRLRPARADASAAALKGKCFPNEIKEACSPARAAVVP